MKISLLEFGEGDSSSNSMLRLQQVFDYAMKADELGFNRLWLAEHHTFNRKRSWGSPLPLIPVLANLTQNIRIGTGGVLLKIHSPYDIAANFKLWNNIFQNRIDLGLANGGSFNNEILKISGSVHSSFDDKFADLISFLKEEDKLLEKGIVVSPYYGTIPDIWALGASGNGFHRALKFGTNYVRSIFHEFSEIEPHKERFELFKQEFSEIHGREVKTMLSISGACLNDNRRLKELKSDAEKDQKNHLIGSESFFRDKLPELLNVYGVDEILWRDMNKNFNQKIETLEILAEFINEEYCVDLK